MDSTLKKRRDDELDRISSLPSDVTQKILSFLPIREAVRTSVLSSNWRHKWAVIRHLFFDSCCLSGNNRGYGDGATRMREFVTIVDRVLLLHSGSIDSFILSDRELLADASSLDRWVLYLLRNSSSLKEFVLKQERSMHKMIKISSCLFLLPDLTRLELSNCLLKPPVEFRGFPKLRILEIYKVIVAQDVLEKIISCLILERLTLRGLRSECQKDALQAASTRFTHLNIDAPNLQFLNVGHIFKSLELKNTPNLVGMKVTGFRGVKAEVDFLKALLSNSRLQELEISFGRKQNMIRLDDNWNCTSNLLRVLKITGFSGNLKDINFIRGLLSSSPVLERMTLQPNSDYVSWELPKLLEELKGVKKTFMVPSPYIPMPLYSDESSSDEGY